MPDGSTIDIHPHCTKPSWIEVGAWCYVWGEGGDLFRVSLIGKNAAMLVHYETGTPQGWESFTKLHR